MVRVNDLWQRTSLGQFLFNLESQRLSIRLSVPLARNHISFRRFTLRLAQLTLQFRDSMKSLNVQQQQSYLGRFPLRVKNQTRSMAP
jgi:hypothetical protein